METMKSSSTPTPNLNRFLLRTLSKLFRIRRTPKIKYEKNQKDDTEQDKLQNKLAMDALFAMVFACVSSIKATYAQLQISQSPFDPDGIQSADQVLVKELKRLAELKQNYLKKQKIDGPSPNPEATLLSAELEEQKSLIKMYEITGKKLDSEIKLKDSEITFLREKLGEYDAQNRVLENRIDGFGENFSLEELSIKHFVILLEDAIESIGSFVKVLVNTITESGLDLAVAASCIEPNACYRKVEDILFVFESFVCRAMFGGFQFPKFGLTKEGKQEGDRSHFLERFMELKSSNVDEYLGSKPRSTFGKFCRVKYLGLVHPKMELAFFGDLNQRNILDSGVGYPETVFFVAFAEMAKQVWLLHCLGFAFESQASVFQVKKGCRFSEVFMENVVEDEEEEEVMDPRVGFTVVPGFKIGRTIIQSQVYVSEA